MFYLVKCLFSSAKCETSNVKPANGQFRVKNCHASLIQNNQSLFILIDLLTLLYLQVKMCQNKMTLKVGLLFKKYVYKHIFYGVPHYPVN